jgi:hypothetical protein
METTSHHNFTRLFKSQVVTMMGEWLQIRTRKVARNIGPHIDSDIPETGNADFGD